MPHSRNRTGFLLVSAVLLAPSLGFLAQPTTADNVIETHAALPSGRYEAAAVWTGTAALIFGGHGGPARTALDEIVRYDPAVDQATLVGRLPFPRTHSSAVWDARSTAACPQGCAYVFGGSTGSGIVADQMIVQYDPASQTARAMGAKLPRGLGAMGAVWTGSTALLFGGADSGGNSDAILRFDPAADRIDVMAARLPTARHYAAAAWSGPFQAAPPANLASAINGCTAGCAYVFGGRDAGGYLNQVVRYDLETDTIQVMAGTLPSMDNAYAAVWDGFFAYIGGSSGLTRYDPLTDTAMRTHWVFPSWGSGGMLAWDGSTIERFGGCFANCGSGAESVSPLILRYTPDPLPEALGMHACWFALGAACEALPHVHLPTLPQIP